MGIGEHAEAAPKIHIPAMFTTGTEDHASRLKGAFDAVSSKTKVLAQVTGADHMYPLTNGALNPWDAHFLGCHVADLQSSCDKIYGSGSDSICKGNSMMQCEVVGSPSPTPPAPLPVPTPTPTPPPAPSPIPGGEPSVECLECWQITCSQITCSGVEQTDCEQCMKDGKAACIPIWKPPLFGQKMMDWFCNLQREIIV